MIKKVLLSLFLIVLVVIISGLVGLLLLRRTIGTYATYWQQRAEQPGEFTYVVLGDSIAQSIGASQAQNGYVGLMADHIKQQTGKKVRVINVSVTGARIEDLLQKQLPVLQGYTPDLVTVEIGANNMRDYNAQTFAPQYERFLKALPAGRSVVSNMPYFNARAGSTSNARLANQVISRLTSQYNIPMVDIYTPLQAQHAKPIYAADFFHPNNRGYRIWYGAFLPAVDKLINNAPSSGSR